MVIALGIAAQRHFSLADQLAIVVDQLVLLLVDSVEVDSLLVLVVHAEMS